MYPIQKPTSRPYQTQVVILPDGTSFQMVIRYKPMSIGWIFESITYGTFIIRGMRIVNSPNMLHQYINQIPFGIACYSTDNREPQLASDFSSGASVLYVLDANETAQYLAYLKNG